MTLVSVYPSLCCVMAKTTVATIVMKNPKTVVSIYFSRKIILVEYLIAKTSISFQCFSTESCLVILLIAFMIKTSFSGSFVLRSYIHTYMYIIHTYIYTYIQKYICTYIHTCILAYIHTITHTHTHICNLLICA